MIISTEISKSSRSQHLKQAIEKMSAPEKKIVMLDIDRQVDFVEGGALAVTDGLAAIVATNKIIHDDTLKISRVFKTQDWHPKNHVSFAVNNEGAKVFSELEIELPDKTKVIQVMWPLHCVENTKGAEFHPAVVDNPKIPTEVIPKGTNPRADSYSGFGCARQGVDEKTELNDKLCAMKATHVIVAGLAEDFCVAYTAKDAILRGYKVCVPLYATRPVSPVSSAKERALMTAMGVVLANTPEELKAWVDAA